MTTTYTIHQIQPSPSMCENRHSITGTFSDAISEARRMYALYGRSLRVTLDIGSYAYFVIDRFGNETNRNMNAAY